MNTNRGCRLLAGWFGIMLLATGVGFGQRDYIARAAETARWIETMAVESGDASAWAVEMGSDQVVANLYSGVAGVTLFYLELYDVTGEARYLKQAQQGAEYLTRVIPNQDSLGLYTGVSGIAFALIEAHKRIQDPRYLKAVQSCLSRLKGEESGAPRAWNGITDIIGGASGIGLFLIYAARELEDRSLLDSASLLGEQLVGIAQREGTGLSWAMSPEFPREMPNFSHGTAGVAYFLAELYGATGKRAMLDAALSGARYLTRIANTKGNGCLILHHEPGGEELYYLGWCHGPPGSARLFFKLWQETNDLGWMEWVERAVRSLLSSGLPQERTPGFWNNVGQCCGTAGIAEFFLDLFIVTGRNEYRAFARRLSDDILARAEVNSQGMFWRHAEHRVRPEDLTAQTGYMQGAAGIGMLLLHMSSPDTMSSKIYFPDSPFAAGRLEGDPR